MKIRNIKRTVYDVFVKIVKANTYKHLDKVIVTLIVGLSLLIFDGDACLIKRLIGVPCPGCGMTRAFLHLFKFDLNGAFFFHPLFILPVLIALLMIFRNNKHIKEVYKRNTIWLVMLVVVMGVWAVRMVTLFPDVPPMDLNRNSILIKVISFVKNIL